MLNIIDKSCFKSVVNFLSFFLVFKSHHVKICHVKLAVTASLIGNSDSYFIKIILGIMLRSIDKTVIVIRSNFIIIRGQVK